MKLNKPNEDGEGIRESTILNSISDFYREFEKRIERSYSRESNVGIVYFNFSNLKTHYKGGKREDIEIKFSEILSKISREEDVKVSLGKGNFILGLIYENEEDVETLINKISETLDIHNRNNGQEMDLLCGLSIMKGEYSGLSTIEEMVESAYRDLK